MNERDQAEIEAEELLAKFPDSWSPSCREVCNAVAGVLRKRNAQFRDMRKTSDYWFEQGCATHRKNEKLESELDAAKQEIERLKTEPPSFLLDCSACGSRMHKVEVKSHD